MVGSMQSLSLMIGDSSTGTCMASDTAAHEFIHALGKLSNLDIHLYIRVVIILIDFYPIFCLNFRLF